MSEDVLLSCPHCRREYKVSLDLAKLARVTSRASCARCKKVFEITPERIRPVETNRPGAVIERNSAVPTAVTDAPSGANRREGARRPVVDNAAAQRKRGTSIPPRTQSSERPLVARTKSAERPVESPAAAPPTRPSSPVLARTATPVVARAPTPHNVPPVVEPAIALEEPVQEVPPDWVQRADPGLAMLATEQSEGCAALEWLLEH